MPNCFQYQLQYLKAHSVTCWAGDGSLCAVCFHNSFLTFQFCFNNNNNKNNKPEDRIKLNRPNTLPLLIFCHLLLLSSLLI